MSRLSWVLLNMSGEMSLLFIVSSWPLKQLPERQKEMKYRRYHCNIFAIVKKIQTSWKPILEILPLKQS